MTAAWVGIVAGLALGCGSTSSEQAQEPEVSSPSPSASSTPSGPVDTAVADLVTRLGVEAASVEIVGQEAVTWRDGSLGCAKPGFSYTQALVEGSRITLRAEGSDYEYHSGGSQDPFWCEKPTQ